MIEGTSDSWPIGGFDPIITDLQETYLASNDQHDFKGLMNDDRLGKTAIVSSFGAESAVLIHYIKSLNDEIPVIFIDTGKHFQETLAYRDEIVELLDVELIVATPDPKMVSMEDPEGDLHGRDPNACCTIRKTFPLQDVIGPFDSWISGRKRYQSKTRATVPVLERDAEKIKINPLAFWDADGVADYFKAHDIPRHPLEEHGFLSIGCMPCTRAVRPGEDPRAGRWADAPEKTECGIHLGPDGRFRRSSGQVN